MYDSWIPVELIEPCGSVLSKFEPTVGRTVTASLVGELIKTLSAGKSTLDSQEEVKWCLQVLSFGLKLSFSTDYTTLRDCVRIHCDWLSCLTREPHPSVPSPLKDRPTFYAKLLLSSLLSIFEPRPESNNELTLKQTKECHYVLRIVQSTAEFSVIFQGELWPETLSFMMRVGDILLTGPFEPDDLSDHLCSRVLTVLLELWLTACSKGKFPSPCHWRRLRELMQQWRHHRPVVDKWIAMTLALTHRVLSHMFGEDYSQMLIDSADINMLPPSLSDSPETLVQVWFRVLHLFGSPSELSSVGGFISSASNYRQLMAQKGSNINLSEHFALQQLPFLFFRAIHGVTLMVAGFLGESVNCTLKIPQTSMYTGLTSSTSDSTIGPSWSSQQPLMSPATPNLSVSHQSLKTPMNPISFVLPGSTSRSEKFGAHRDSSIKSLASSKSTLSSNISAPVQSALTPAQPIFNGNQIIYEILSGKLSVPVVNAEYSAKRPNVDSLFHLFGDWLFSAASIKSLPSQQSRASSRADVDSLSVKSDSSQHSGSTEVSTGLMMDSSRTWPTDSSKETLGNEAGKSEAIAAVLKILCSKKTDETVSSTYIARVFAILANSLNNPSEKLVLANSLVYGVNIFRINLREAYLLLPYYIKSLEVVLQETAKRIKFHPSIPLPEMRRAAIYILSSYISAPFQYAQTVVSNSVSAKLGETTTLLLSTFIPTIAKILLEILNTETDSFNLQLSLGLSSVLCAEMEERMQDSTPTASDPVDDSDTYVSQFCQVLVTNLLESRYVDDYAICMAAMDTLLNLAKYVNGRDVEVGKRVISVLCRVVERQLSRPPPAHSRDLHSTVVSAYHTVGVWLVAIPSITHHRETLNDVTRVIELGLTGTTEATSVPPKPASQRVRDAAEHLSLTLFTKLGDEFNILSVCTNEQWVVQRQLKWTNNPGKFQYFLLDNSVMVGLLEEQTDPTTKKQIQDGTADKRPGIFLLLRTVTGLEAWRANIRFRPLEEENKPLAPLSTPRPIGVDPVVKPRSIPPCFPPEVDVIPQCKADKSLPVLKLTQEAEKLRPMFQISFDKAKEETEGCCRDLQPPKPVPDVHLARLLLNDLGYLRPLLPSGTNGQILRLNSDTPEFLEAVGNLDSMSDRLCCSSFIFYVTSGVTGATEIIKNGNNIKELNPGYCRFLANLGLIVGVPNLKMWSNGFHKMTDELLSAENIDVSNKDELKLDGSNYAIYWSDLSSELLMLVPSAINTAKRMASRGSLGSGRDRTFSSPKDMPEPQHFDTNRELENMKELKTQLSLALNYTARKRSSSVSDADMPFSAEMEVKSPTEKISVWKSYFSRSKRDNKLPGESKPSRPISNQTNNLKLPSQSVKMPSPTEENTPVRKISAPENHYDNFLTVSTPPTTPNSHSQGRRSSLKNFFGGKKEKKKYLKMSDTEIFARKLGEVNNIDSPKRHLSPQKFHFPRFFSHSHHLSRSTNSSSKIDAVSSDDSDGSEYEDQLAGLPDLIDLHSPNKTELSRTTPEGPLISPPIFRSDLMRNRSCSIDLADLPLRQTQPKAERNDDITAWSSQVAPTISPYTELGVPIPPPRSKSLSHQGSLQIDEVAVRSSVGLQPPFTPDQSRNSVNLRPKSLRPPTEWRTLIVWLENFEDLNKVPIDELIFATDYSEGCSIRSESCVVIFIHPMGELYRLSVKGNWGKLGFALPITDGLVVRERILPTLIQQTILSVGRRRRLEQEGFQMSHMKRRQKLQEIGQKFGKKMSSMDFCIELLTKCQ